MLVKYWSYFLGVKILRQRVHDLFNRFDGYLNINIHELQEKIVGGEIQFSGMVHYDKVFFLD